MRNELNKFRKLLKESFYDDRERLEQFAKERDPEAIKQLKRERTREGKGSSYILKKIAEEFSALVETEKLYETNLETWAKDFFKSLKEKNVLESSPLCIKYLNKETSSVFLYKIVKYLLDYWPLPSDKMKKNLITAQIYHFKKYNTNGYLFELIILVGYDERMFNELYKNSDSYNRFRLLQQYVGIVSQEALPIEQLDKFIHLREYYSDPETRIPYYPEHGGYNTRER